MEKITADKKTYWNRHLDVPDYPAISKNLFVDACIIGGGIAGISVAYALAKQGKIVALIEKNKIASGESHKSTAHLSSALDDGFVTLKNAFGLNGLRLAIDSHRAAIDRIEQIITAENIDCDFKRVPGYLFSPNNADLHFLHKEFSVLKKLGYDHISEIDHIPFPDYKTGKAIRFDGEGQFHPLKYIYALAEKITGNHGCIFEHTQAVDIVKGDPLTVQTNQGFTITAKSVIVATHVPFIKTHLPFKTVAYRSYALGIRCAKGAIPDGLYCDTMNPYHNIRISSFTDDEDLLIAGGEDHRTGEGGSIADYKDRIDGIYSWAKARIPSAGKIEYMWSGQVMEPIDHLAYIGRIEEETEGLYVVCGGSGHGLTHATIAGLLIPDLIDGKEHAWAEIYSPLRKLKDNHKTFLTHNARYLLYMLKGLNIFARKSSRIKCPHTGAPLAWNDFEKSFECPCYGCRFDATGQVLNGPASHGLHID